MCDASLFFRKNLYRSLQVLNYDFFPLGIESFKSLPWKLFASEYYFSLQLFRYHQILVNTLLFTIF